MDLMPILSTLRRHKIAAGLIVLEVALSCAIVANALHLIATRIDALGASTGLAEAELIVLEVRGSVPTERDRAAQISAEDLAKLRAQPGVKGATVVNQMVFGQNSNNSGVTNDPGERSERIVAAQYESDEHFIGTLGLQLVEGRNFRADEVLDAHVVAAQEETQVGQVIINRALAARLFPGKSALGQSIYVFDKSPSVVVGVVDTLTHPYLHKAHASSREGGYAMLFPIRGSYRGGSYVLRVDPGQRDAQLKTATAVVEQVDPSRVIANARTLSDMRRDFFAQDRAMAWLMGGVCLALLLVTGLGIVGLASFWVQQRSRMIGTRRALGATERQILRYFQLENLLLTSAGIALGSMGAMGLALLLMAQYQLPRLPWGYLPAGAVSLWLLGQLAVWVPARRAAKLPPVVALRS